MDFSIPDDVSTEISERLQILFQELQEGDITEKGYRKHREIILNSYKRLHENDLENQSLSSSSAKTQAGHSELAASSDELFREPVTGSGSDFSLSGDPQSHQDDWNETESIPTFDSGYDNKHYSAKEKLGLLSTYRSTAISTRPESFSPADIPLLKLQKPLDPRELAGTITDPHNQSVSMSKFDNLPSILRHRGNAISRKNAFIALDNKGREVSTIAWDKLSSRAEKVAQVIRDKSGLYRGDRVALLYLENEVIDFAIALLGCFLAGVVAVPINPKSPLKDLNFILGNTQSHLVLTTDNNLKSVQRTLSTQRLPWPREVEWWKTNEFGSYHPPSKKADLPALQVPDLAYIEFSKSPVGDLRGVVMSHRTILHQMTCLTSILNSRDGTSKTKIGRQNNSINNGEQIVLCNLDIRQSIGLIIGILLTVYSGNTMVWIPQSALTIGGLYANVISRYRINILLSDYPGLKQVAYNYQSFPHLTRSFSKKQTVNFASIKWCLIDAIATDTEFHEILADRWLKPLGNKNAREIVAPMLTLSEHGGMVISMRDWLKGEEKLGCVIKKSSLDYENSGPSDLSEVLLDKLPLTTNTIKVVSTSPNTGNIVEDTKKYIRIGAFGYPIPDATLAIVNPETCVLSPEMVVGEIWIDSPSLSGGFWGLGRETDTYFHATCRDANGIVDMEFLRTGLLGFVFNGKVYVLGLYEDRLRQKVDWNNPDETLDVESSKINFRSEYRYHYTSHLIYTVMRSVPRVFDCSAFDIFVNGEHLPVIVLESALASIPTAPASAVAKGVDLESLNELSERCIDALYDAHKVRVYCILVTAPNSLPRIIKSGRSEIGNMLCKRQFDMGIVPAIFVKFGIEKAIRSLPIGHDPEGGIWSSVISQIRTESLADADKQYSGVDFREVVIDDRTTAPLSDFKSIIHLLQWRVSHQSDELAFSTIDNRAREGKGLSWKKFDQKVATVAISLKTKLSLKPSDQVILLYTHSEDFIVAVYACLILGITAIPVSPVDVSRLSEDIPALVNIIKDFSVKAILVNGETESSMKIKTVSQYWKQISSAAKVSLPTLFNTNKLKQSTNSCKDMKLAMKSEWIASNFAALVWLYWTADHRRLAVQVGHENIMGMCKIQKETCQMSSTKPVVGCVRSVSGLGFLHSCFMGVYLGASTLIVSPIDYASNPGTFFLTLSRYKVKDTYSTPQMLDHACAIMKPKGFSLADTKNLMISFDGRPRTDICKRVRILFAPTGLEGTSINLGYSHVLNPMITTRSYMSLEPVDLWLDPIALRQGYVSVVNPENYPNALHLHDSGMVPVGTQVAIVNPETCRLCRVGEYGEIWVYSEGNVNSFYKSKDPFNNERFKGKIVDGNSEVTYVRTADLGFLHNVSRGIPGGNTIEMQTLFVLGSIGETFEVLGLNHFPIDVELSIERCHKAIIKGGSAIFQAGGFIILVVEVNQKTNLASLVPVIVNTVLDDHQFVVDIVAFVGQGNFPRSRLREKQRGRILTSWVAKKLNIMAQFGVSQGERSLNKAIKRHSNASGFLSVYSDHIAEASLDNYADQTLQTDENIRQSMTLMALDTHSAQIEGGPPGDNLDNNSGQGFEEAEPLKFQSILDNSVNIGTDDQIQDSQADQVYDSSSPLRLVN